MLVVMVRVVLEFFLAGCMFGISLMVVRAIRWAFGIKRGTTVAEALGNALANRNHKGF